MRPRLRSLTARAGDIARSLVCIVTLAAGAASQARDAETLWAAGERQAALSAMQQQLALAPDDAALRLALAQRQSAVGQWEAALATAAPLGPDADGLRGTALYILTRFDEALPLLDPSDRTQCLMRLDALLALSRLDEADAALAAAVAVRGPDDEALRTLRGRLFAAHGRHADAVPEFRATLERDPLDRAALFGLGQALLRTGERDEGLRVLERHRTLLPLLDRHDFALQALDLDPLRADHHAQLGDIERELQRFDRAEQCYLRAAELADLADLTPVVLRHARLLHEDRDAPDAAVALLDATFGRVLDPRLAVRAADVLLASGRATEAVSRLEQLAAARPEDVALRKRLEAARAVAAAADPPAAAPAEPEHADGNADADDP